MAKQRLADLDIQQREGNDRGTYIYVHSGIKFYLNDPRGEEMRIEDVAHALARQCRFTGHVDPFYSVGEHSVRCAEWVANLGTETKQTVYTTLMHDCSETWLVDLPRPVKAVPQLGARYLALEDRIMTIAAERFNFDWPLPAVVKVADATLLNTEVRDIMPKEALDEGPWFPDREFLRAKIRPWSPKKAEAKFLELFELLAPR